LHKNDDFKTQAGREFRFRLPLRGYVSGIPTGAYDQMIAGHARSCRLIVVTNNTREFQRVPGIRVENWVQ